MHIMKIKYSVLLLLAAGLMASCSDDEKDIEVHSLGVVSAKTSLNAIGDTAVITAQAPVVKAYATDPWLNVSVQGSEVRAIAGMNKSIDTRHTTVVLKSNDTDSAIVNVSQFGVYTKIDASDQSFTHKAFTKTFDVYTNCPVTVSTTASWLKAVIENGKIIVTGDSLAGNQPRVAYVKYTNGLTTDSVAFIQQEYTDFFGHYYYFGGTDSDGQNAYLQSALVLNKSGKASLILGLGKLGNYTIPVTLDKSTMTISIPNAYKLGNYLIPKEYLADYGIEEDTQTYLYTTLVKEDNLDFDAADSLKLQLYLDPQTGLLKAKTADDSSIQGFTITAYIDDACNADNALLNLFVVFDTNMQQYIPKTTGGAKALLASQISLQPRVKFKKFGIARRNR